jgi:hypothetical protein
MLHIALLRGLFHFIYFSQKGAVASFKAPLTSYGAPVQYFIFMCGSHENESFHIALPNAGYLHIALLKPEYARWRFYAGKRVF